MDTTSKRILKAQPIISGTARAQFSEGLHSSAFHFRMLPESRKLIIPEAMATTKQPLVLELECTWLLVF